MGGAVVMCRAFSTAALSAIGPSNCRMIGAPTPTTCPSPMLVRTEIWVSGSIVVKLPVTGTVLPSVPSAVPDHMYFAS